MVQGPLGVGCIYRYRAHVSFLAAKLGHRNIVRPFSRLAGIDLGQESLVQDIEATRTCRSSVQWLDMCGGRFRYVIGRSPPSP